MKWKIAVAVLCLVVFPPSSAPANPWNGKVVLQTFWWDCWNEKYPFDWYTYIAKLCPRLRDMGFDGIWIPPACKGDKGKDGMGYDLFDHYDLGEKDQKGSVFTRFGTKDSLLRLIAVAHANGIDVYLDIVLNHVNGGEEDPAALGNKYKKFRYAGFSGPGTGRWAKDWWNFHPNPDHGSTTGNWCDSRFGPDVCYLDGLHGGGGNGQYMRDRAREWFVWLTRQTGPDGFRFDAVKHFPAYVVEDLLYNAMGSRFEYFCVGEYVGGQQELDEWCAQAQNRSGTFDFSLREALANIVEAGGYFDMGSLPNYQQKNRLKTAPFVNNHDTWRGAYWDSNPGSNGHDDRENDWRQNGDELAPTIDPDNDRADVAYAAAFALDGSPVVFYEDLFVNYGPERFKADAQTHPARGYLVNLLWCHQKLDFKDGAYKVRYQGSQDLLVIERSGKALIGLNDHGKSELNAWVQTDFGSHVKLHDYSGATLQDLETDDHGWVKVAVPAMSYAVWGPVGFAGGFSPAKRRTTQEFQLDDDLGDSSAQALGYGGRLSGGGYRTAGAIWPAVQSTVKVWVYTEGEGDLVLRVLKPDSSGAKSQSDGSYDSTGTASSQTPLHFEFRPEREGYHQLLAKAADPARTPCRAYVKIEYEAPQCSDKF